MEEETKTEEDAKKFCERCIRPTLPTGSDLSWGIQKDRSEQSVFEIKPGGRLQPLLRITDDALDMAGHPDDQQWLASEIAKELKVTESGGVGYVRVDRE